MTESVAELLGRLRFAGGPVETLCLNQPRVRESFVGQLGAIESFTRSSAKEGTVEAPIVKIGAGLTAESGVTWTLSDPTAQVLVLHAALNMRGAVHALDDAAPGQYVDFAGAGAISRPGMLDAGHQAALRQRPGLYAALEAERAAQENVLRMMEGQAAAMWLLTLGDGAALCAAVLNDCWLSPSSSSWLTGCRWWIFAMLRRVHETATSACSDKTPPPVGSPGQRHRQGARREQLACLPVGQRISGQSRPAPVTPRTATTIGPVPNRLHDAHTRSGTRAALPSVASNRASGSRRSSLAFLAGSLRPART